MKQSNIHVLALAAATLPSIASVSHAEDLSSLKFPSPVVRVDPASENKIQESQHGVMGDAFAGAAFIGMIAGLKLGARFAWNRMVMSTRDEKCGAPGGAEKLREPAAERSCTAGSEQPGSYVELFEPLILADTRG